MSGDDAGAGEPIDRLAILHLTGAATPAERELLQRRLRGEERARQRFAQLCEQDIDLREALGTLETRRARRPRRTRSTAWIPAAAAALLIAAVAIGWYTHRPPPYPAMASEPTRRDQAAVEPPTAAPRIATLDAVRGEVRIAADGGDTAAAAIVGMPLPERARVVTGDGHATVSLAAGAIIELEADSELRLPASGSGRLELRRGRLQARVAHRPTDQALVFVTAAAEATIVGTAFDLACDGAATALEVSEGRVELRETVSGTSIAVPAGSRALAAPGVALAASPLGAPRHLRVGAGAAYATLADLPELGMDDIIELAPGIHREVQRLVAKPGARIAIVGLGSPPPLIEAAGLAVGGDLPHPRAALQLEGGAWRIENLAIADARNGDNGAGVRGVGVASLSLRGCAISACDIGLNANGCGSIALEDCVLDRNGFSVSVGGRTLSMRGCDCRGATRDNVYTSAVFTRIAACRISGSGSGQISFHQFGGDPAIGNALVVGCLIEGASGGLDGQRLISFLHPGHLSLINATLVSASPTSPTLRLGDGVTVTATSTIFAGTPLLVEGDGRLDGSCDWLPASAAIPPGLTRVLTGADPGFAPGSHRLDATSPCLDHGATTAPWIDESGVGFTSVPDREPPEGALPSAPRARHGAVDVGAFER